MVWRRGYSEEKEGCWWSACDGLTEKRKEKDSQKKKKRRINRGGDRDKDGVKKGVDGVLVMGWQRRGRKNILKKKKKKKEERILRRKRGGDRDKDSVKKKKKRLFREKRRVRWG